LLSDFGAFHITHQKRRWRLLLLLADRQLDYYRIQYLTSHATKSSQQSYDITMSEKESDPYKVCLTWPGGRETISLATTTTLHDLAVMANEIVGSEVTIAMGYPPKTIVLADDITARSVVPRMMRLQCTVNKKRVLETSKNENENDSRKKRANENKNIVDLTEENTVNDDAAYALRLHQEDQAEIEAAALRNVLRAENVSSLAQPSFARPLVRARDEGDPTLVDTGRPWIFVFAPESNVSILGKWLVFPSVEKSTEIWRSISSAVASGALGSPQAKISTKSHPEFKGNHVICVYTTGARMDEVGLQLIQIAKQNLCYKTDDATDQGIYSNNTKDEISIRQLYWNKARPVFIKPSTMTAAKSRSSARKAAEEKPNALSLRFDGPIITLTGMLHFVPRHQQRLEIGKTSVVLVREPQNSFDKNAIRVDNVSGAKIGYIQKKEAAILAPWLDDTLVRIDSCVMNHRVGDSTMYLLLKGWACELAKEMLATL
jgi:hypothetical protein